MPLTSSEKQAAYRERRKRDGASIKPDHIVYDESDPFWKAFPARPNDLAPTPAQLKKLGETIGSR